MASSPRSQAPPGSRFYEDAPFTASFPTPGGHRGSRLAAARPAAALFLRLSLAASFLAAVADRLGLWATRGAGRSEAPRGGALALHFNPLLFGAPGSKTAAVVTIVEALLR